MSKIWFITPAKRRFPGQKDLFPAFTTRQPYNSVPPTQWSMDSALARSRCLNAEVESLPFPPPPLQVFELRSCTTARIAAAVLIRSPVSSTPRGGETSPAWHYAFAKCINKSLTLKGLARFWRAANDLMIRMLVPDVPLEGYSFFNMYLHIAF